MTATQRDDTVAGDATPNELQGATGEDFLNGGRGADTLSGGGREDMILSRDGTSDRVSCGAGYDFVVADGRDLVPRAAGCEYVDDGSRSAPAAGRDMVLTPRCAKRADDAEISPPRTRRRMPLDRRVLVPLGSRVDSIDCAVKLTVGIGAGRRRGGVLRGRTARCS